MKRIVEAEMTIKTKKFATAINKFFRKYPELDYWKEAFEYMAENNKDFECDNLFADGTDNDNWSYALHLDINDDNIYICVIERA